jgi:tRNA 2-thiouridine synthesizing protein A
MSEADSLTVNESLDACGLTCPLPLLKAKQALNRMEPGHVLYVICTDPGSVRDFEVFARQSGNELVRSREDEGQFAYWLRKTSA